MERISKEQSPKTNEEDSSVVERLFARLDELEIEEKMTALKEHETRMKELKPDKTNHVRFKDSGEDDAMVVNGEVNDIGINEDNCIRFKHTKQSEENEVYIISFLLYQSHTILL